MAAIDKLIEIFSQFPGIGPRQSKRFVYFLLTRNGNYIENLIRLLSELKADVRQCDKCFRYFPRRGTGILCPTCADTHRDASLLLVVSRDVDLENIEKSHVYDGYYFVLGGSVPILEKEPAKKVRSKELFARVQSQTKDGSSLKEIILAMNANPEGENTAEYLKELLAPLAGKLDIKLSTLGRGLSTGTELEYSDDDTIKNALKNRI